MEVRSFNLIEQQGLVRNILADETTESFFLLNNSDRPDRNHKATRELGTVSFTIIKDGQSRIIRVPPSWVPIDASMQAPKKDIAASAEFQRAFTSGAVMVLDHDTGIRIIKADMDSQREYERVMSLAQNINGVGDGFQAYDANDKKDVDDPWANVNQNVKVNVSEVVANAMNESEFRSFMRREARSISTLDKKYISEHLPDFQL